MGDKETLATQVLFAGRNIVENLNFVPDDKWDWKPEATAKSAHEIIDHMLENFVKINGFFGSEAGEPTTDKASGQAALLKAADEYAANVRAATPEQLTSTIVMGPGPVPIGSLLAMTVIDICHHHGQICYLQTLWGDNDFHFDVEAFGLIA